MTIDTLLTSPDMYVLFDGCPTCHPESAEYLDECRIQARKTRRRLHIVPSGSTTAMLIRTVAKDRGLTIKYPMILMDGTIQCAPRDITPTTERTAE